VAKKEERRSRPNSPGRRGAQREAAALIYARAKRAADACPGVSARERQRRYAYRSSSVVGGFPARGFTTRLARVPPSCAPRPRVARARGIPWYRFHRADFPAAGRMAASIVRPSVTHYAPRPPPSGPAPSKNALLDLESQRRTKTTGVCLGFRSRAATDGRRSPGASPCPRVPATPWNASLIGAAGAGSRGPGLGKRDTTINQRMRKVASAEVRGAMVEGRGLFRNSDLHRSDLSARTSLRF
jgi:hypothetical protein